MTRRNLPRVLNQRPAKKLLEENGWEKTLGGQHSVKMTRKGERPITLYRNTAGAITHGI